MVVDAVMADAPLPEVPVIVSVVDFLNGVDDEGVNTRALVPLEATLAGSKTPLTLAGRPVTVSATRPAKPLAGATVMVSLAGFPPTQTLVMHTGGTIVTLAGLADSVNEAAAATVNDWETDGAAA